MPNFNHNSVVNLFPRTFRFIIHRLIEEEAKKIGAVGRKGADKEFSSTPMPFKALFDFSFLFLSTVRCVRA